MKKSIQWSNCSESELLTHLKSWLVEEGGAGSLSNAILFLEGEMGAGKSTLVRVLLSLISPGQVSHGSPTFPIVQEYHVQKTASHAAFPVYHLDLYRIKKEEELYEAGIDALLDSQPSFICIEWASLFPDYFQYWLEPTPAQKKMNQRKVLRIEIAQADFQDPLKRNYSFYLT